MSCTVYTGLTSQLFTLHTTGTPSQAEPTLQSPCMLQQSGASGALPGTQYTLHFTLYTVYSTLYTLHSTLYTLHSTLYTLHSTLYTLHSTLYTLQSRMSIQLSPCRKIKLDPPAYFDDQEAYIYAGTLIIYLLKFS